MGELPLGLIVRVRIKKVQSIPQSKNPRARTIGQFQRVNYRLNFALPLERDVAAPLRVVLYDYMSYSKLRLLEFVSVGDIFCGRALDIGRCILLYLLAPVLFDGVAGSLRRSTNSRAQNCERGNHYTKKRFTLSQSNFTETSLETPTSSIVTP